MRLSNKKIANPFIYQGYESPAYFCDREMETKTLLSHLKNGRNVTLISPRRIGKTGLIKNTFFHLKEEEKELVYRKAEGYVIYDRFMDLWLRRG